MEGNPGGNFRLLVDRGRAASGVNSPGALPERFLAYGDFSAFRGRAWGRFGVTQDVPAPGTPAHVLTGLAAPRMAPGSRWRVA